MAITFPIARASFFARLPLANITFDVPENNSFSRTKGGDILTADNGARLWQGEITLGQITRSELATVRPMLTLLRGAGTSFLMNDPTRPYPQSDPTGSLLAGASPVISGLPNARELSISGLPSGYVLSPDDMLGFSYASSPMRRALHQVVTGGTAGTGGNLSMIEVTPPIRPGAAVGAAITLIRPVCKAVIVPGSYQPGRTKAFLTEGISFRFCQTLR